jgi:hypothetical protein
MIDDEHEQSCEEMKAQRAEIRGALTEDFGEKLRITYNERSE